MNDFLLYPENAAFIAGQQPYPASLRVSRFNIGCAALILMPFMIVSTVLMAYTLITVRDTLTLAVSGTQITGQVIAREEGYDEGVIYSLTYTFTAENRSFERRQYVSQTIYNQYAPEQPIPIRYQAGNPDVSRIEGTNSIGVDAIVPLITSFVGIFAFVVAYGTITTHLRLARLRRDGRVINGQIGQITAQVDNDNDYQVTVQPHFITPDTGERITGKRTYTANHLKGMALPQVGTRILITYLDAKAWEVL